MSVREWLFGPDSREEDRKQNRVLQARLFDSLRESQALNRRYHETFDRIVTSKFDPPVVQRATTVQPFNGLQMPMGEDILSMDDEQFLEKQ